MDVTKLTVGDPWEEQENDWRISLYSETTKRPVIIICGETEHEVRSRTAGLILALEGYHVARQLVGDLAHLPSEHQKTLFETIKDAEQHRGLEPPPGVQEARIVKDPPVKSMVQEAIKKAIRQAKENIDSEVDNTF